MKFSSPALNAIRSREPACRPRWLALATGTLVGLAAALAGCGGGSGGSSFAGGIGAVGTVGGNGGGSNGSGDPAPVVPDTQQASAESRCKAFLGRTFDGATITKATFMPATDAVPEHCIVRGEMPKDLDFDVRMPTEWNHRTVFRGGGGFDGYLNVGYISDPAVSPVGSPDLPKRGYATIATNHGHDMIAKPGGSFALDEDMLADYAYASVPRVLVPAKSILRAHYGDSFANTKMVYEGCSGGGRQALMQAQRHPDLFDGIIARAPANAFTSQFLWYQKIGKQLAKPGAALSAAKIKTIGDAVYAKCDGLDGLNDRIIGKPEACQFDPVELACNGAETDACLTPAQVESAQAFYAPTSIANGRYVWPGFLPGGETAATWGASTSNLGGDFIKYMVAQDASVDPLLLDPAQYTARLDQLSAMLDAVDPDLSRFKAKGGKLVLWTGQTDWLITANNATEYYQSVVKKSGGQSAADEFVEYYTAPGVEHCNGGNGADKVDLAGPMFEWIEKGTKPSSSTIVATQRTVAAGATPASRPLCRYPQYPRYVGGDPNAAASFACTSP
ncbi:Tannase and feruloyl esterase [Variovorax sp. CF313]|uniref:tannase/feruloyl esterase family alpha/beta hydrolase n=1 Tax=Variovorax sp. CF313 TaxID=1144315 RepID=UPI0002712F89|nr:tannase/feruloyl esterase family alpha/beta hydrolase [Variovorax sp. CF313]EJL71356.1 Tannase and feruloyl esterase [Variovorax sp. CF313]